MCELLGLSFAKPVSAAFSIREFAGRGQDNADGWGLAWYPDRSAALIKEPIRWRESGHTGFLESYAGLQSQIYIAHVRHRTTGGAPAHADTHPFLRELRGRDYCFAHNGTIEGSFWELPLGPFRPVGQTDSEHLFCHILGEMALGSLSLDAETGWRWFHQKLLTLNARGRINCLFSDGRLLFCYHDANGWKGLAFCKAYVRDSKASRFEDAVITVDLKENESVNHGFVVATQPLGPKGWQNFQRGELLVFESGLAKFSSHREV